MLIEGFSNSVYLRLAERVTEAVRDLGFRPTIGLVAADATAIRDQVANWQSERLEGVFVGPLWQASLLAAVEDAAGAMPVVTYGAVASPRLGAVVLDFDAVWQRLLDHLRSRGHDKIGWVGQTIDWEAAARTGLPLSDAALATLRAWTLRPPDERNATDREDALRGLVDRWRSADPSQRPTAFMCNNDNAAMYLMTAFREAGVAIPQEVSITGLDNVPESRHLSPPLTTMDLNIRRIAERATALLMERIDEPTAPPRHERRVPELVVRESVGPPH
jgi:LacI family transcriptional regulator